MEEEYRMQKAQGDTPVERSAMDGDSDTMVTYEDGSTVKSVKSVVVETREVIKDEADDDASIRGVKESPTHLSKTSLDVGDVIPTIRISTESDIERERDQNVDFNGTEATVNGIQNVGDTVEKPVQAAAENGPEAGEPPSTPVATTDAFSFSNKRLCERWLDNLFMVLYEV
jgi:Chs5-Arf1p-binding protein BUD7/BCH1